MGLVTVFSAIRRDGRQGVLVEAQARWRTLGQAGNVVEVEFTEWTPDGPVRHPSFQGVCIDKPAAEVVRERQGGG